MIEVCGLCQNLSSRRTWHTVARLVWVTVQLTLVYCAGQKGALFFYQAF